MVFFHMFQPPNLAAVGVETTVVAHDGLIVEIGPAKSVDLDGSTDGLVDGFKMGGRGFGSFCSFMFGRVWCVLGRLGSFDSPDGYQYCLDCQTVVRGVFAE